jgi:mono/diheme cytochrome c family protein
MQRPASRIEPISDVPDVLDFPRDIQPILDKHCVACHNADRRDGSVNLSGDHTPLFSQSYWEITHRGLISDGRNERYGNRPPRDIGSSASRLLKLMDGSHYEAQPSPLERKTVRLWIESSAVYAGTYAALGSGMHPVEFPVEVMERRCGECHGAAASGKRIGEGNLYFRFGDKGPHLPLVNKFLDLQQIRGSIGYYKFGNARPPQSLCNLTRPEKSLLLRAPLSEEANGLGLCSPAVFADTKDPDYQTMLARITAASTKHRQERRFDMPGFRPNIYYVRMMQRLGFLPQDLGPTEPFDIYAVEQAYWKSFWY